MTQDKILTAHTTTPNLHLDVFICSCLLCAPVLLVPELVFILSSLAATLQSDFSCVQGKSDEVCDACRKPSTDEFHTQGGLVPIFMAEATCFRTCCWKGRQFLGLLLSGLRGCGLNRKIN